MYLQKNGQHKKIHMTQNFKSLDRQKYFNTILQKTIITLKK